MSPVYQIFNMITAKEDTAVPFPYPKRAIARLPKSARERSYPVGNRPFAVKPFVSVVDRLLPDPPKSP